MAENNNPNMKIGIGFTTSTDGLEQLEQGMNRVNKVSIETTASLKGVENAVKGISAATAESTKVDSEWLKNLRKERDAGVKTVEDYNKEVIAKAKELRSQLDKIEKAQGKDSSAYKEQLNVLATVNKEAVSIMQKQVVQKKSIEAQKTAALKQELKEQQAAEKAAAKELAQIWRDTNNQYKSILAQRNATSSLKDFTAGFSNRLSQSMFNTAVSVLGIQALTAEFQNLGRAIIDIDYNLVNTQRIMGNLGDSDAADALLEAAAATAKVTNTTITDAQEIQSAWVRINDTYADNMDLLTQISELTSKFMNVGEIEDAEHAVTLLNASLLQFNINANDAMQYAEEFANKWAYMADITAMGTADEYGEAIARFGANVKSMNGDMDEAIALSSIMADNLAKSGAEAGTSLKTFTSYMNRSKTRSLFADIALDLNDTSYQLEDANGKLKDFDDNLRTIAKAYDYYKSVGNDVMAQQILEAVGATRQRDTAMAVLNSVNNGSYDKYLEELQSSEVDNYLNEQNAAMLDTFAAKWNELAVSIQEFGMSIARSGVLDIFGVIMNGFSGLLGVLSDLPSTVWLTVSAFAGLKVMQTAASYLGNLTGITKQYQSLINQGTQAEVAHANSISASANAYMKRMEFMGRNNQLTQEEIAILANQKLSLDALTHAYNNGEITAEQYSQAVTNLIGQEQLSANAKYESAEATLATANAQDKHIELTKQERAALEAERAAQEKANQEKEEATAKEKELDKQGKILTNTIKAKNAASLAEEYQAKKTNIQKALTVVQEKIMNSTLLQNIANTKLATILNNVLGTSFSVAGTAAAAAATGVSAFMAALGPIMAVVSIVMTVGSLLGSLFGWIGGLFGGSEQEAKSATEQLEKLKTELDEVNEKIQELEDLKNSDSDNSLYDQELNYWKERKQLIEDNIEAQKELIAYQNTFEDSEDSEDDNQLQNAKNSIEGLNNAIKQYQARMKDLENYQGTSVESGFEKLVAKKRREITEYSGNLISYRESLQSSYDTLLNSGMATTEQLKDMKQTIIEIDDALGQLPDEGVDISEGFNMEETLEDIADMQTSITELQDDMDGLFDNMDDLGNSDPSQIIDLIDKYNGFYSVATKSTQDQILFLKNMQLDLEAEQIQAISDGIDALNKQKDEIYQRLADNESGKIPMDDTEIKEARQELENLDAQLDELQTRGEVYLQAHLELPDLSDATEAMESLVSSTKDLVEAQNQLAQGTALSKQELYDLAMTYPELLYQADLFNTTSVEGQQAAINAVLGMKNDEFNNTIDLQIAELEAQREFIQGVLDLENDKLKIVSQAEVDAANGRLNTEAQVTEMLGQYNDLVGQQFTQAEQYKLERAEEGAEGQVEAANQAGQKQSDASANAGEAIAANITAGAAGGVTGLNKNANKVGSIFETIKSWASNLASGIAKALAGDTSGTGAVSGAGVAGDATSTFKKASYNPVDNTIDGLTVSEWTKVQKEALQKNIDAWEVQLGQLDTAIGNLEDFKNQGLTNVSNNYSGSGAGGKTGNETSNKGSSGKSDAEKAAEEAAKAMEEAMKAIEKLTEQYIKNVESLQDRIVNALKKKYQEQYDERKKLLEKEHNERVEQIQAEIDAINGERPEDKQAELSRLESQLEKWMGDDSTLGKAKQKEYLDQIEELKKEIKLDELEQQLEDENEKYEQSIDSDSEFYDAILNKLDDQMTDEMLYREANDMIRNQKIDEITALLTEFDAQWDGWATLMGKTAGEIIAEEVALAIANYKDVINGTVTPDGGKETNKVTGGGSSSSSSGSSSSGSSSSSSGSSSLGKGSRVKITDTSAGMYYTSTSKSAVDNWKGWTGSYYIVNTGGSRYALGTNSSINSAIGWIDKKYVKKFNTGGYTGSDEGFAYLHSKERVLSARQTSAFENLVYDFLPRIESSLLNPTSTTNNSTTTNNNGNVFNKELVSVNIGKVVNNTPFDIKNSEDNLDRMFRQSLRKSGINLKH